jgi:methylmalonyl-CoA mutase N-terminal domain/subunit
VETLTNKVEEETLRLLGEIEGMGGIVKAVETGWIHSEISNSAYAYQQAIESGKMPIVGVNCYQMEEEELPVELFEVPETLQIQEQKIKKIKDERNGTHVREALDAVARCCDKNGNLMEVIVQSVKARVTQGEISHVLKGSYGTWDPPIF